MLTLLYACVHLFFVGRVLLRPHRDPASRIAWLVTIIAVPWLGVIAYLALGETNVGDLRRQKIDEIDKNLPKPHPWHHNSQHDKLQRFSRNYASAMLTGAAVNGLAPTRGNQASLMADSNAAVDAIVADMDAAQSTVHLSFYIWLDDINGLKLVEAASRAAQRGVTVRAMADAFGSRTLIASEHWQSMENAGVHLRAILKMGDPLLKSFFGRVDLRNHRKIVVIDNHITYCGSQNAADPEFRVKAAFAPWVDILLRFAGPVAQQHQYLFVSNWLEDSQEDLSHLLEPDAPALEDGFTAQVIGTGPTIAYHAMSDVFSSLMYAARKEMVITTPYFVPDDALIAALLACARRGVVTTLILPQRNDSWVVQAASRSYYRDLIDAGVQLYEFHGGLLHAKTITVDGCVTLIGSANMDRRSIELNYENNILFEDPATTDLVRQRQTVYLQHARRISAEEVLQWPVHRQLWNNLVATVSPLL